MKTKCLECDGDIEVPDDAVAGEIVSCPDCGMDFEVTFNEGKLELKPAEEPEEDWGE